MKAPAYTKKHLLTLFILAITIRAIVFFGYIQKYEYYKQPDSNDYHFGAITTGLGYGLIRSNGIPSFWRTPGYPLFLSIFYQAFGITSTDFSQNWKAQTAAIIFQIIFGALIAILIFYLTLLLTNSLAIAWITSIVSAIHPGFILSDLYILTENFSILFLIPFFIFFFKSLCTHKQLEQSGKTKQNNWLKNIIFAAIFLAIFTWIRPMGQFLSVIASMIILLFDNTKFKIKIKKIIIFLLIFFTLISPWYIRNYNLTGKIFYCPMLGLYLNTFNAPKIIRATENLPLQESINKCYAQANALAIEELREAQTRGYVIAPEITHGKIAWPIIAKHPILFLKDWTKEVAKTAFDLYSYQLVSMTKNTFYYDPIEEFLTEKLSECLYKQQVPIITRIIIYLEILFEIIKWLGLIFGLFIFWLYPLVRCFKVSETIKKNGILWLKISPFIAAFIGMTGGFGYARLRLPVEGLMVILSLTFWIWLWQRYAESKKIKFRTKI